MRYLQKEAGWVGKQIWAFEEATSSAPITTFNPLQVNTNFVKIQVMAYAEDQGKGKVTSLQARCGPEGG
jgi:hypothetical protein